MAKHNKKRWLQMKELSIEINIFFIKITIVWK